MIEGREDWDRWRDDWQRTPAGASTAGAGGQAARRQRREQRIEALSAVGWLVLVGGLLAWGPILSDAVLLVAAPLALLGLIWVAWVTGRRGAQAPLDAPTADFLDRHATICRRRHAVAIAAALALGLLAIFFVPVSAIRLRAAFAAEHGTHVAVATLLGLGMLAVAGWWVMWTLRRTRTALATARDLLAAARAASGTA